MIFLKEDEKKNIKYQILVVTNIKF